jgi:hypothetical protein
MIRYGSDVGDGNEKNPPKGEFSPVEMAGKLQMSDKIYHLQMELVECMQKFTQTAKS